MIRVEGLTKAYEGQPKSAEAAVADLTFDNETGQFLTLLGPSGCGKSTTLRCIAGLETPDAGQIQIGDQIVFSARRKIDLSPAKRRIGMVFQSYAIWPHMSVMENVAYPLRFRNTTAADRRRRAHQVLEIVGLDALADRPAPRLSGGQQQRVALARALVGEPEVLLLDEPLSNLDASLRKELGGYLRQLQQELALTVIYVTHDQGEAMSMSDTIALMNHGRIAERDEPVAMYSKPKTRFAASFLGDANYLRAESVDTSGALTIVTTPEGNVTVGVATTESVDSIQQSVMVRPESFLLSDKEPPPSPESNRFECRLRSRRYFGGHWEYRLETAGGWHLAAKGPGKRPVEIDAQVWATVAAADCILVSDDRTDEVQGSGDDSVGGIPEVTAGEEIPWLRAESNNRDEDRDDARANEEV